MEERTIIEQALKVFRNLIGCEFLAHRDPVSDMRWLWQVTKGLDQGKLDYYQDLHLDDNSQKKMECICELGRGTRQIYHLAGMWEKGKYLVMVSEELFTILSDIEEKMYALEHKDDAIKVLDIDIETYCDVSVADTGVYRYAEDDSFEIILFAYNVNGGKTTLVDLLNGEEIPDNILSALTDKNVLKIAHNAAFERICLSRYLRDKGILKEQFLSAEQWDCTMVRAARLGLPLSLDQLGKVLGIEKKKMREGKALITYFCCPCKPTRANGRRERNLPHHAPDKWTTFKQYCKRDVDAEMEIGKKVLSRSVIPWDRKLWELDQRINDRGVKVDLKMARVCERLDTEVKDALTEEAKRIMVRAVPDQEPNPGSMVQMKNYLKVKEGIDIKSLGKENLSEVISQCKSEDSIRLLHIRKELGKTSNNKYSTMLVCACKDERVRGITQFYGASRTGRWCVTGDHEVLTPDGWVRLDEWNGGRIACWNIQTEIISFQKAEPNVFDYTGEMYHVESKRCSLICTPNHKIPYWTDEGWKADEIQNLQKRHSIPFWGRSSLVGGNLDDDELRILVMTQADGHYTPQGVRYHFKKERKIQRCKTLLRRAGITFIISTHPDGTTAFEVKTRHMPLYLRMFKDKTFGSWLLKENADVFFEELEHWDGSRVAPNSSQYSTCSKQNADIIQALAILNGRSVTMVKKHENVEKWSTSYVLNIWRTPGANHQIRREYMSTHAYEGKVYCPTTATGFFVVRRNGKCWITGNSGRLVQLQNLPQNHIPDIDYARNLVKMGDLEEIEMCYGNVPQLLSELIRTALVAKDGYTFHVCDFSAIECRVLAWLAGEEWVLDTFRKGGDIYCATASKMFGVPVEKHGQNAELRQKGKIATLALGYEGGVGALAKMGGERMGLTQEEMAEIVKTWRGANPNIVKFWRTVENAAKYCVENHEECEIQNIGLKFKWAWGGLRITLPSGRFIFYPRMKVSEVTTDRGMAKTVLTYEGQNQITKHWEVVDTYGGKMTENITQAIARDLLGVKMLEMDKQGCDIVFHVHDEAITEAPIDGDITLKMIEDIFAEEVEWCKGLPLQGAGYTTPYYMKD